MYLYNTLGQLTSKTDFNGQTTSFAYDSEGRLSSKTYPDSSTVTYTYDQYGKPATVTDSNGAIEYDYDILNRLASVARYDSSGNFLNEIGYGYDWNGNRTLLIVDNGTSIQTTNYTFDDLNRLATVTDPDGRTTSYTYDNIGNRESVTYPNNTQASYVYDELNRLTYLENRNLTTSSIISSYAYELGAAGNRVAVTEHAGRRAEYGYDQLYRLTQERIRDDGVTITNTISYTYDFVGNRLGKTDNSGYIGYTYDANDRLLTAGGTSFTYDNNGNTLTETDTSETVQYAYDFENRLTSLNDPVSGLTAYLYDPSGNRLTKTDAAGTTRYLVDTNQTFAQVLQERLSDSSLAAYTYGDDLINQHRSGVLSFYHYDGNLSTRQLTDLTAAVTDTYTYDAFGNLLTSAGTTLNNYLYTGEQYDPNSGFYYLRARYHSPSIGRFLTKDIFNGNRYEPLSLHKYFYAHANPVNNVDPSGERTLVETVSVAGIVALAASLGVAAIFNARTRALSTLGTAVLNASVAAGAEAVDAVEAVFPVFKEKRKVRQMIEQATATLTIAEALRKLKVVPIPRSVMPNVASHILLAVAASHPLELIRVSPEQAESNRKWALRNFTDGPAGPHMQWDEYPFASGRPRLYEPSIMAVPELENRVEGGILQGCYLIEEITPDTPYLVVVIP